MTEASINHSKYAIRDPCRAAMHRIEGGAEIFGPLRLISVPPWLRTKNKRIVGNNPKNGALLTNVLCFEFGGVISIKQ